MAVVHVLPCPAAPRLRAAALNAPANTACIRWAPDRGARPGAWARWWEERVRFWACELLPAISPVPCLIACIAQLLLVRDCSQLRSLLHCAVVGQRGDLPETRLVRLSLLPLHSSFIDWCVQCGACLTGLLVTLRVYH